MARIGGDYLQQRRTANGKKDGAFFVQLAVPRDLWLAKLIKSPNGRPLRTVEEYLGTRNRDEAERLKHAAIDRIKARFDRARKNVTITDAEIQAVAEDEARRAYDALAAKFLVEHDRLPRLAAEQHLAIELDVAATVANPLLPGNVTTSAYAAQRLARMGVDPGPDIVDRLANAILAGQRAAVDALQRGAVLYLPSRPARSALAPAGGSAPKLSDLVAAYVADRTELKEKTRKQIRISFALFKDAIRDDVPFDAVDRSQVAAWVDGMVAKMEPATVNAHLSKVGRAWKWCQDKGRIPFDKPSPFTRHWRKTDDDESTWLPFTTAELKKLLQPSPIRWHIITGLFSGMRDSEIVTAKLRQVGRLHYFEISTGKTKAAKRNVPVHPVLIELDIAKWWPSVGKLSASKLSKRFTRWRRRCGITRDRVVFHSLRKNVGEALERAQVPESTVALILGHKQGRGFSFSVYSPHGPGMKMLAAAVRKIGYRGLKVA